MITVNGELTALESPASIKEWLQGRGIEPELTAVEYNGKIITREDAGKIILQKGDRLEIVRFVGGG